MAKCKHFRLSVFMSIMFSLLALLTSNYSYANEAFQESGNSFESSNVWTERTSQSSGGKLKSSLELRSGLIDGKLFVPKSVYLHTVKHDYLKPYDAYTRGQVALNKEDPESYGLLESASRRGCNQAKMLFANCLLPKDHPLKNDGTPTFALEGKQLNNKERMQRYLKWMNSAAENGSSTAAKSLADLYRKGEHVGKDANCIFKYTKLAAQAKDPEYMYKLGTYYYQGLGCERNSANAEKWMKQASHLGNSKASSWLSEHRENERRVAVQSCGNSNYESRSYDNMVWISATGSKYHSYNSCGRMNPARAYQMSKSQAEAQGYGACKRCH